MRTILCFLLILFIRVNGFSFGKPIDSTERTSFKFIRLHGAAAFNPYGLEGLDLKDNGFPYELGIEINVYQTIGVYASLAVQPMMQVYSRESGPGPYHLYDGIYTDLHARSVGYQFGITSTYSLLKWLDVSGHIGFGRTRFEQQLLLINTNDLTSEKIYAEDRLLNYSVGGSIHARLPNNLGARISIQASAYYPSITTGISYYLPTAK